jgi:hypothetical protein
MEIPDKIEFEPINQGEYRKLKKSDPANFHSYTARIVHKYFRRKDKMKVFEDDSCRIEISDKNINIILKNKNDKSIGKYLADN